MKRINKLARIICIFLALLLTLPVLPVSATFIQETIIDSIEIAEDQSLEIPAHTAICDRD